MKEYVKNTLWMVLFIIVLGKIIPEAVGLMGIILMFRMIPIMSIAVGFPIFLFLQKIEG